MKEIAGAASPTPWSPLLMRMAAIASIVSAITTCVLIFFPNLYTAPQTFADRVALGENDAYQVRAWTAYAHPFLCMLAAIGVWRVVRLYERGLALVGILCFGLWAYTEALQIALTNVAVGWNWVPAFAAGDPSVRAHVEERASMFFGLWDSLYFLLLTGFLLGNLCFGFALLSARGTDKVMGLAFLLVAALALLTFFAGYGGPAWTASLAGVAYPALQPALRLLTGLWLWRSRHVQ